MCFRLRRFFAYFLVLLLPLQALATVTAAACGMVRGRLAATEVVMEDCDHQVMMQAAMPDADLATVYTNSAHDHPDDSTTCGMSSSCFGLASITVIPNDHVLRIASSSSRIAFISIFYLSHIPEGLQRPPQASLV